MNFDAVKNYQKSKRLVGYKELIKTSLKDYMSLGFKSGLEVHQQLKTQKKLFCRCPSGIYQEKGAFDSEIIRHMRPTLSELGQYDGTALMEFKTRKNITYRIKYESACTYDIDDTPPFKINHEALKIALEVSLLLKLNIVGELHIIRKQYLDGSIPAGFQRTGIIGIEGEIPLKNKLSKLKLPTGESRKIKIIQLSIEEDSCREVLDLGHERVFTTDRLGTPLIETVTYPEMITPAEVANACHYIRFLARSTGRVNMGNGAGRQDVNVSIKGGTRVEIKGVSKIKLIPKLTHIEAFRQKALLTIKDQLQKNIADQGKWKISWLEIKYENFKNKHLQIKKAKKNQYKIIAVNLSGFKGVLSHFTQPQIDFSDEISGRLKVIACLERPNLLHSEQKNAILSEYEFSNIAKFLNAKPNDAQLVIMAPKDDVKTALETIEERCKLAFNGVPNETRKPKSNGTTVFERVLPGADRMYPDTDSAPIAIPENLINSIQKKLPVQVIDHIEQLENWKIPDDMYHYILRNNLMIIILEIVNQFKLKPLFVCSTFAHQLKNLQGKIKTPSNFNYNKVYDLFDFIIQKKLEPEIIKLMLPLIYKSSTLNPDSIYKNLGLKKVSQSKILSEIPIFKKQFNKICTSKNPQAETCWVMGKLKKMAVGHIPLKELKKHIEETTP